jgi:uroporphyrinogen III methyltransferase / synthase
VLMGVEQMGEIVERLIYAGRPAGQPAAVIQWGTTPRQRTIRGTLATIVEDARLQSIKPPAILVAGEVAALHDELSWFERLPLFGLRVLVTRSRSQASILVQKLRELGAAPVELPSIDIHPAEHAQALDHALAHMDTVDWVVFTSANGVRAALDRLLDSGRDVRALAHTRICAIGPATARALSSYGLRADLVPARFISTEIVEELKSHNVRGRRIVLFRSDIAPADIVSVLENLGASVESLVVYRTVPVDHRAEELRGLLDREEIDVLTFTSSSTVTNFVTAVGQERIHLAQSVPAVCIGPTTSETARAQGLRVESVAREYTVAGLVAAITGWASIRRKEQVQV